MDEISQKGKPVIDKVLHGVFCLCSFIFVVQGMNEGILHKEEYRNRQKVKHAWCKEHGFELRLIITTEGSGLDSKIVQDVINDFFGV